MNTLDAIRNFAKPGYCPVKRTRIFNNRWYLVTMQNVERDPRCDYIGLGEGEYVELLPGDKARERRDAHLNHCNRIAEYHGTVYELLANRYGGEMQHAGYYATPKALETALDARKAEHDKWIAACLDHSQHYLETAIAVENGTGKSIMTAQHLRESGEESARVAAKYRDAFRANFRQVR